MNIGAVLERCELGTRAFYRHFASKDELVAALFLELARVETRRLRRKMNAASTAVDAVAAWVYGRLDLAFDPNVTSDLRLVSEEAQTLMLTTPPLMRAAFAEMLRPLIEQLERGLHDGDFHDIDPERAPSLFKARYGHASNGNGPQTTPSADIRARVMKACLRSLCLAPQSLDAESGQKPGLGADRVNTAAHCGPIRRRTMDLGLAGAKAVVTGGSKGMGLAIAETLATEGASVAVMARGKAALDAAVESLRAAGAPEAVAISVDMADPESIIAGFDEIVSRGVNSTAWCTPSGQVTATSRTWMPALGCCVRAWHHVRCAHDPGRVADAA